MPNRPNARAFSRPVNDGPSIRSGNWNRVGLVGGLVRGFVVDLKEISIDVWRVPILQCILSSKLSLMCNLVYNCLNCCPTASRVESTIRQVQVNCDPWKSWPSFEVSFEE